MENESGYSTATINNKNNTKIGGATDKGMSVGTYNPKKKRKNKH